MSARFSLAILFLAASSPAWALRASGYAELEVRAFPRKAAFSNQHGAGAVSGAVEPELYHAWSNDKQSATLKTFLRVDQHDPERTHFDIREAYWETAQRAWELRLGIRKVFWGVIESQHLVDIINQTDLVENPDGEDRLGQPMANLALISDWGTLDLFLLTGFRERTFPGDGGRLRTELIVDTAHPSYESPHGPRRIDMAARWSRAVGGWDLGLSHFSGTSREPRGLSAMTAAGPVLIPRYDVIDQSGLDAQWTISDWLCKLEVINRSGQDKRFAALTAGFEYTLTGLFGPADMGLLAEYLYDERGKSGPSATDNDVFAALRLSFNDAQSAELLAGIVQDLDTNARFFNVEGSRRFGEHWKLEVEGRAFAGAPPSDPFYGLRKDSYLQTRIAFYF